MKLLSSNLKGYGKECVLSPLFKFLESGMELFVPIVVAAIIDKGIGQSNKNYVLAACGILFLCGLLGLVFAVIAQYFAAKAAVGFSKKIRHKLFVHINGFSYKNSELFGASTLITRTTSDVNQVQTGINLTLRLVLRSPFIVFGALGAAFFIDVPSATVFALAIPLLGIVVWLIMGFSIPLFKRVQAKTDEITEGVRNNLYGARVIRAFTREKEEQKEFTQTNKELIGIQLKAGRFTALLNPLTYVIVNFAIILILRTGAIRVDSGNLTQGQVVALYSYLAQILVELIKLANLIITLSRAAASAKRIQKVLDAKTGEQIADCVAQISDYALELRGAALIYPNSCKPAISEISVTLDKGQTLGIIGGTGSGKSSVAMLLTRFLDASEGEVFVNGKNVKSINPEILRNDIGLVPQKSALFCGTIKENLLFGNPKADDSQIFKALEAAQCLDIIKSKALGLETRIEQNGAGLSGGQKQRLCIARALIRNPSVLIMDDSCSALDYLTEANLRSAIEKLSYNPTVVIISQRASSVLHADKILVLDNGKQVGLGKHEQLMSECEVYREIYQSQFNRSEL